VYDALQVYVTTYRSKPTVRALAAIVDRSPSTVQYHLRMLERVPDVEFETMFADSECARKQAGREILAAVGFDNPAYVRVRGIVNRLLLNNVEAS